jgi:hypothetical protein
MQEILFWGRPACHPAFLLTDVYRNFLEPYLSFGRAFLLSDFSDLFSVHRLSTLSPKGEVSIFPFLFLTLRLLQRQLMAVIGSSMAVSLEKRLKMRFVPWLLQTTDGSYDPAFGEVSMGSS